MPTNPSSSLPHAQTQPGPASQDRAGQPPLAALWRTREYLRPYYGTLALMLAAAIGAAGAMIAIPLLIKAVIDGPIEHGNARGLIPLGLAAIALGVTEAGLNLYRRWVQASAITGMERSMRDSLYAHLQRLHAGFHDEWQSGQLLSRATTDLSAIRRFAGFGIIFFITNVVIFIAVIALLIRLNWWLGLLTGCVFLPVVVICTRFERRYRVLSRRAQDQEGDLATYVEAAARHAAQATLVRTTQMQKARLRGTFWAGLDLVPNAVIGLILLLGALAVSQDELTLGGLVAFIALALQLVWPIEAMGYILASGQEAATAAQRIYEIFDTEPAITDPVARPRGPSAPEAQKQHGRLRFDRVTFRYPGARAPLLRGVSLELEPGETVALVGPNGAGKTTLLELVPRLAEVSGGAILLDGTDVSYGAPGADEEAIRAALAAAQADFVADLPWGLDTRIGEQGMALSGGQRQRVALARAILARPAVLLLDDPLSALDVHTEAKVTRALAHVLAASTALVVAHRPSTVMLADRVALLDGGVITAVGSHQELMATQARYRELMTGTARPGDDLDPGREPDQDEDLTEARR